MARFSHGDEVAIISSSEVGVVDKLLSPLGDGNNIYLVKVGNVYKTAMESNLRVSRKKCENFNIDLSELGLKFKLDDKYDEIISGLALVKPQNDNEELANACKLAYYLVTSLDNEDRYMGVGTSVIKNQLYHGLFNDEDDSIISSLIFSTILRRVGMDVLNVAMKGEDSAFYVANLVLIGGEYYYFDVYLEKAIFIENGSNLADFVLCSSALGRSSYEQFFKPLCLIGCDNSMEANFLPNNISNIDIDVGVVNRLLSMELEKL